MPGNFDLVPGPGDHALVSVHPGQPQRQAILNSDRFRGQFSDQERNTISNLLAVEPYLPVQRPNDGPSFGK